MRRGARLRACKSDPGLERMREKAESLRGKAWTVVCVARGLSRWHQLAVRGAADSEQR